MSTLPEAKCLDDEVHEPHDWASLTHRWSCPGRTVRLDRQKLNAEIKQRRIQAAEASWHQVGDLEL